MGIEKDTTSGNGIDSLQQRVQEELYSKFKSFEKILTEAGKNSMLYLPPENPQEPIVTVRLIRLKTYDNPILLVGVHPLSDPPETYRLSEIHGRILFVTREKKDVGDVGIVELQRLARLLSEGETQILKEDNIQSIQSQQGAQGIPHMDHGRGMKPSKIKKDHLPSSF